MCGGRIRGSRTPLAFGALLALTLAACGGAEATTAGAETTVAARSRPAWERTPMALLPRDAFLVAHVDGAQLRRSPYFPFVETLVRQLVDGDAGEQQIATALIGNIDEAWIGVRDTSSGQLVGVVRGANLDAAMRRFVTQVMSGATVQTKGRAQIWQTVSGSNDAVVRLEAKTWVFVIDGGLPELLTRVDGGGEGDPLSEPRMRATAERIGFSTRAPLGVVAHLDDRLRRQFAGQGIPLRLLAGADYVAGRLDASNGLAVDVTADMLSADAAAQTEDALRGVVSGYASNPMVALMGFSDILRRIEVRATGARVDARATTTDEETRSLLERYGELLGAAISRSDVQAADAPLALLPRAAARR